MVESRKEILVHEISTNSRTRTISVILNTNLDKDQVRIVHNTLHTRAHKAVFSADQPDTPPIGTAYAMKTRYNEELQPVGITITTKTDQGFKALTYDFTLGVLNTALTEALNKKGPDASVVTR